MYSINQVTLLGKVDNIIENSWNGNLYIKFSIETERVSYSYNDKKEVSIKDWHYITLWRDRASQAKKYLRKGDYVYVIGELTYKKDKNDEKKIWTEVNISDKNGKLLFLGPGLSETDFIPIQKQSAIMPPIAENKTKYNILDKKPYATNVKSSKIEDVARNTAKELLEEDDIPF